MTRRPVAILMMLAFLVPSVARAQAPKAGVVTTLEGNVTARRVALPAPVSLKFKDDIFLQDTVTTGDRSLARMLLGGKAVVTVRERSVLTITEVPGRSTLELESGKFALAVAREKMRPGEEIQIRTPNAVAGVRGTVVITEVNRQGAQIGAGVPAVVTNFYVLRGTITAQPIDASTRQPIGTPVQVGALESYSGAGNATPRVAPVPPEQVAQITAGLQPSGAKPGSDAGQDQVKTQAMQTAVSLLSAINGGAIGTLTQTAGATSPTVTSATTTTANPTSAPIIPPVSELAPQAAAETLLAQSATPVNDASFIKFSGVTTLTATTPLFDLSGQLIVQTGSAPLISVEAGAVVSMASQLLRARNSTILSQASGLDIRGQMSSTATGAFLDLDPTTIDVDGNLIIVSGSGATLTLAGPLLRDVGGTLATGGPDTRSFLVIHDSAVVKDTSSEPFISLTSSTVTSVGSFLSLRRSGATPSTLELAGPFLVTSGGSLTLESTVLLDQNGAPRLCCGLFGVGQGAVFTGTTTSPLISLAGTSLTVGQNVLVFFDTTSIFGEPTITAAATATLTGPLFKATGSTSVSGLTDFLGVFRSSVSSTTTEPFLDLNGTSVSMGVTSPIDGSTTAGRFVNISANSTTPSSLTLRGPLLNATDSIIFTTDDGFGVFNGATLSSTTTSPLISISGGSVTTERNGNFFAMTSGSGLPGGALTLAGPLLVATGATLSNGTPGLVGSSPQFFTFQNAATLTNTTTSALVSLAGSVLDSAGNFLDLRTGASATLAGPLLVATNSTIDTSSLGFGSACCNVFRMAQGATLTSTGTGAFIQVSNTKLSTGPDSQSGGHVFDLNASGAVATDAPSANTATLAGPLLTADNSTVTSLFHTVFLNASTLTSTTTSPLISLSGTSLVAGGLDPFPSTLTFGRVLALSSLTTGPGLTGSATLAGPLLSAVSSTITANANVIGIFNGSRLTSTTADPFVTLNQTTVTNGTQVPSGAGAFLAMSGTGFGGTVNTLALAGPLLSVGNGSTLTLASNILDIFSGSIITAAGAAPFVTLAGGVHTFGTREIFDLTGSRLALAAPLLSATGASLTTTASGLLGLFSAGVLTATTTQALVQLAGTSLAVTNAGFGAVFRVQNSGSSLILGGPLLSATNSTLAATSQLLNVNSGGRLESTAPGALFQFSGGSFSGSASVFSSIIQAQDAGSLISLTGPLLSATGGTTLTIRDDALAIFNGASLTSTTTAPLIQLSGSTLSATGATFADFVRVQGTSGASVATLSLNGTLLALSGSTATATTSGINLFTGGRLTNASSAPLVSLDNSSITVGTAVISGLFLNVSPGSTLTLAGPILQAGNSGTLQGPSSSALLFVGAGGGVSISGLTSAVVSFTGGSLGVGTVFSASRDSAFTTNGATTPFLSLNTGTHTLSLTSLGTAAFSISGVNTADEVVDESVTLTVGTDQPLRHGGALVDTTSATANVAFGVIVDKALLNATAPIFDLKSSSNLSVTNTLIGVQNQGKIAALGPVIKLNASTLSAITNAINVSGGSLLRVTGDLVGLANGSTLSVANGALLNVSGSSVVTISGALINFGGTGGNTVSVTNNFCSTSCATVGGIPVLATNDASILITNPIKNSSLGTLSLSGSQAAAIVADGAGTKVTISGN